MLGLYAAVTRQTVTGKPIDGWFPNERITIAEAIKAYTYNTAYANFEETKKGSIEVGKLADLTVLSKNLLKIAPKEYLTTDVIYTIVDGKIVYESREQSGTGQAKRAPARATARALPPS
jgi:predicted amidohydrolase YtcJ